MTTTTSSMFLSGLSLVALLLCSQSAMAQYGLEIPVRGGSSEVKNPDAVEVKDEGIGIDVVSADTPADAANAANDHIRELESGTALFETEDGGVGLMASGSATYSESAAREDIVRLSRRKAYVLAYFRARANAAETINGASTEAIERMSSNAMNKTSDDVEEREGGDASAELILTNVKARLQGIEIFEVQDLGGEIKVTVFCTQESAGACATKGRRGMVAGDLATAINRVFDEVVQGFVPPVGARTIFVPETGQYAFIGYGSALVRSSPSKRGKQMNMKQAELASKLRADRALVARLTGQEIDYSQGMKSEDKEVFREWDKSAPEDGSEVEGELSGAESSFVSTLQTVEEGVALTKGKKPAGVQTKQYLNEKTGWLTTVHLWIPASEKLLGAIRNARPSGAPGSGAGKSKPQFDSKRKGPTGRTGPDPRKKKKK